MTDMMIASLPRIVIEPAVRNALLEDLGLSGDITSNAVIPAGHRSRLAMVSRKSGIIAG